MSKIEKPIRQAETIKPVAPEIENYIFNLIRSQTEHPILTEMEERAERENFPIVGRIVGHFLYQMARTIGAKRVFEFGSGFGYSAYWFASAVGEGGTVLCTDGSSKNAELGKRYLSRAGLIDRIEYHIGMAQEIFPRIVGTFDICYNDVDKGDYPEVWKLARERIRVGGLYIADNSLWYGRVAVEGTPSDPVEGWTEAIREHNRLIFSDPDFEAFINPIRDGVLVARRVR